MAEIETYKDWHNTSTCFTANFTRIADLKEFINFVQNYSENIKVTSQEKIEYDGKVLSSYYEMDLSVPVLITTETVNVRMELMGFCQSRRIPVKLRTKIGAFVKRDDIKSIENSNSDNKKKQTIANNKTSQYKYQPLTDEELHRLFRNEYLTIDDPRYFR